MIFHSMNMRIFVLCYEFSFNYLQITTRICYLSVGALAPINLIKITINHTFFKPFSELHIPQQIHNIQCYNPN